MGAAIGFLSVSCLILAAGCIAFGWCAVREAKRSAAIEKLNRELKEQACRHAADAGRLEAENEILLRDKESLTQSQPKAQDTPRRMSGAALRREFQKLNATPAEPTQAERLNGNG